MDNVDLSGFCLDLLDLCWIDFSVDCPAGCWGEVNAIRVRAPNNRTPACFQSRYNPFLYFCDVVSLTRICGFVSYGFVDLRALSCGNVMWECFPSTACLPALQGLLPSFTSSVAFKLWVALEFDILSLRSAPKEGVICEKARSLIQYLYMMAEGRI